MRGRLTGSAVHHGADLRVLVELAKELSGHLVVADLGEFECNTAATVLGEALLKGVECVSDCVEDGVLRLTGGLTIGDGNDQDRLPQLTLSSLGEENFINNLLAERGTHGSETLELNTTHNLFDLGLVCAAVLKRPTSLVADAREISVHEAERNAVLVEQSRSKRDSLQNKAQVLDTATFLFELHRSTVINVQDDIVEGKLDDVVGNFFLHAPSLDYLVDLSSSLLRDLVKDR